MLDTSFTVFHDMTVETYFAFFFNFEVCQICQKHKQLTIAVEFILYSFLITTVVRKKDQVSLFWVNAHIWRAWRCAEYPPYYNKR